MTLRGRLCFILTLIFIALIAGIGYYSYTVAVKRIEDGVKEHLLSHMDAIEDLASSFSRILSFGLRSRGEKASDIIFALFGFFDALPDEGLLEKSLENLNLKGVRFYLLGEKNLQGLPLPEGISTREVLFSREGREFFSDPSGNKLLLLWKERGESGLRYLALVSLSEFSEEAEMLVSLARELLLEAFGRHLLGPRGYVQVFSSDGTLLLLRGSHILDEDDLFGSSFVKRVFDSGREVFTYDFKGERKVRAGVRLFFPEVFPEMVVISTAYLSDFTDGAVRGFILRVSVLGAILLFSTFFFINRFLRRGFFSFLTSLSEGFDNLMRGNYGYRMRKLGEKYLDELVEKFNRVGESLDLHRKEIERTYSELLKMHSDLKGSKDELEATYAQLKAYAKTLETLTEELSRSNELLRMIVRAGEELLDLSKFSDPYSRIYESLSTFYKDCTVGIYEPSGGRRVLVKKAGDGEDVISVEGSIVEEALKDIKPLFLSEGGKVRLFVPISFENKLYSIILISSEDNRLGKVDLDVISMLASIAGTAFANKGYLDSAIEKARKLGVLAQISEVLASSRSLVEDLRLIIENIANKLEYDCLEVFLKEGERLQRVASAGKISEIDYGEEGWDISKGVCGWVARYGRGVFIPDVTKDHRYVEVVKGIKGEIVVPILGDGEIYGIINLESFSELSYDDYEILSILGRQIGMALRKERLFKSVAEEARRFKTLYELSLGLSSPEALEDVLDKVCKRIEKERGYVNISVAIYDRKRVSWRLLAGRVKSKLSEETFKKLESAGGVVSKALREGAVVNVPDVRKVGYYIEVFEETLSELAVPIYVGDRIEGVLDVESPRLNDFSKEDEEFFESIANMIGLVLARERLLEDLRTQGRKLESLLHISRRLMLINDEDELYGYLCKALAESLGYKRVAYRKVDWERGIAFLKGEAGEWLGVGENIPLDRGTVAGYVAFTGDVFKSDDLDSDTRIKRKYIKGVKSIIAIPLKVNGSVDGILFVSDGEEKAFTKYDEELLYMVVSLLSSSLDRIKFLNSINKKSQVMDLLYKLSLRLSRCLSEEEVYDVVIDFLKEVESYSKITIMTLEGEELVLKRSYPSRGKVVRLKLGEGITGWVALHGESVLVGDVSKDSRYVEWFEGIKSELAVPVRVEGNIYGVLNLESEIMGVFTEEDRWLLEAVATSMGIVLENISHLKDPEDNLFATTLALAKTIEYKDPYTRGHCERVMEYADALALRIGLSDVERKRLRYACILHDIGKIGVPGRILDKPGRLTDEEYEIVKRHPVLGEELLKEVPFLREISLLVRWHHERWDGRGYPDGLKGYEIPLESRIMAIADAFDAMTSDRPYRRALSKEEAIAQIRGGMGTQFDPVLASEFLSLIEGGEFDEDRLKQ
ncbi:MAG: hypothetical protein PWQ16_879 [bacterium]|nr:hypothetical protein [bacterium]